MAPNLLVGEGVSIAEEVSIGANVVVHDGVRVRAGATLEHGVVLGRVAPPLARLPRPPAASEETTIEVDAVICPFAIVHAGAEVGSRALVGDHASVREGARIGSDTAIGFGSLVKPEVVLGDRARTQAHCVIGPKVVIEEDVFLGPGVIVLTGILMSSPEQRPPPVLRRGCQIGAGAKILPGIEIGEEAVVGAGSVVSADVAPGIIVRGVPARPSGEPLADRAQLG
jgi:UDP-2-acetamido-3-amino-2,3-dideoxy-glucuronate N-acetyltransferase